MGNLVYNLGEQSKVPTTLKLELGVFFDGTNNNLKNTKIRKKIRRDRKRKTYSYIPRRTRNRAIYYIREER